MYVKYLDLNLAIFYLWDLSDHVNNIKNKNLSKMSCYIVHGFLHLHITRLNHVYMVHLPLYNPAIF